MHTCLLCLLAGASVLAAAEGQHNLLPNGDYAKGMSGWTLQPGTAAMCSLAPAAGSQGNALTLTAAGQLLGIDSAPLVLGQDLEPQTSYRVQARIASAGLSSGVFAFSICFYDQSGRRIEQRSVHTLNAASPTHDWLSKRADMGPGTGIPFPPETHSVRLRFSFWEKSGDCRGKVSVSDVRLEEVTPTPRQGWPGSVLITCGPLQTRFESRSFWTLYRLDYQGKRLCKDQFGSHYGTVISFKDLGFVGSGHTENQDEVVHSLDLHINDQPQAVPLPEYQCDTATLIKHAAIRGVDLKTRVDVYPDRIVEEVTLKTQVEEPLNLLYHFMHPWVTDMSHYLALGEDGTPIRGAFNDDKKMKVSQPVRWSAVYSHTLGMGAVTVVLERPDEVPWEARYWDVPNGYRKHYFTTFVRQSIPLGQEFRYRVVVLPFAADSDEWETSAAERATYGQTLSQ